MSVWMAKNESNWPVRDLVDYYEYENECQYDIARHAQDAIEAMRWAGTRGYCLALFSFNPGYPTIPDWQTLRPALDYALAHPCGVYADGTPKYHAIALHFYTMDKAWDDIWIAMRHRQVFASLPTAYWKLPVYFTEAGLHGGRSSDGTTCAEIQEFVAFLDLELSKDPYVQGYHLWSFGGGTNWFDATDCQPF
ncbi:hypothetical protein [Aggregatilinea lenta]|uniref:hypothetical protein n=1 Tax=Aggregatilinea lenta TaxID=913108 RepID=UPI000E5A9C1E|nr:hypothetical protein [Aggregatilinea lenta]